MKEGVFKNLIDAMNALESIKPKPKLSEFKGQLSELVGKEKIDEFERKNGDIIQMIVWGRIAESRSIDFDMYSIEISQTPHIDKGTFILIGKDAQLINPLSSDKWLTEDYMNNDKLDNPSRFIPFRYIPPQTNQL